MRGHRCESFSIATLHADGPAAPLNMAKLYSGAHRRTPPFQARAPIDAGNWAGPRDREQWPNTKQKERDSTAEQILGHVRTF
eukprot:7971187-Pyramimonas_sp.AAC.1